MTRVRELMDYAGEIDLSILQVGRTVWIQPHLFLNRHTPIAPLHQTDIGSAEYRLLMEIDRRGKLTDS